MSTKVTAATVARDVTQFLAFKRAMGMGYRRAEFVLNSFVRFVREQYGERPASLEQAVTRWASRIEGRKAITVGNEFGVVRQLCLFRRRSDPHGAIAVAAGQPRRRAAAAQLATRAREYLTGDPVVKTGLPRAYRCRAGRPSHCLRGPVGLVVRRADLDFLISNSGNLKPRISHLIRCP